ncbi:MAG: Nif3-like dinuclear metal center hexameric protein [Anaerovoracaceae bacterium]
MRIDDFTGMLENIAPLETQEEWDNSGWQIKLTDGEISKVMVALEINRQVIFDAVLNNIDLIITHHPLIFGGINNVDHNNNTGNYIVELIKHGISVYSSHTPFDKCHGGNNDYLGMLLGLENVSLMGTDSSGFCRMGLISEEGMKASHFIDHVSKALKVDKKLFSYAGSLDRTIKKVGWCTGAGADFLKNAKAAGCDLYMTGDVKYHAAQEARELDIAVLDCGHFGTEQIFCENVISMLDKIDGVDIIQCDVNFNPFAVI